MSTVRDVINQAAQLIGRSELTAASESDAEVTLLTRCYNIVANEVALDYFPLKTRETFSGESGSVPFSSFREAPVRVLSVKRGEREVDFTVYSERIDFEAGTHVTVSYAYAPKEKTAKEETGFPATVSERLLAYGVAAEFCLARGYFPEASNFEKKYREALGKAGLIRRRLVMRGRRWA